MVARGLTQAASLRLSCCRPSDAAECPLVPLGHAAVWRHISCCRPWHSPQAAKPCAGELTLLSDLPRWLLCLELASALLHMAAWLDTCAHVAGAAECTSIPVHRGGDTCTSSTASKWFQPCHCTVQAASLRASLAAGAHFDAEARLSPGLLTGAELAALGTPPPGASDTPSPCSIPRPQLAGKPGAAAAAPSSQRSRIPRPARAVPTGRLASGSAAAPARQAKAAAVGVRHSSAVVPAASAAAGARPQLPSALRAPQGGGSSRPAPARRPGPPAAAAATKAPRVSLVDRQRSGPAAVSTAGRVGPAGREASSARAASSSCAPARVATAPAGRHANPKAGASRIPGPAGRGRGRGPRVPPQPPPQPAEEAAPPAEVHSAVSAAHVP